MHYIKRIQFHVHIAISRSLTYLQVRGYAQCGGGWVVVLFVILRYNVWMSSGKHHVTQGTFNKLFII